MDSASRKFMKNYLNQNFGMNDVKFSPPVIINNNNINDPKWKMKYEIHPDIIWPVVESTPTLPNNCGGIGKNEHPLDDNRWKRRGKKYLYCVAPPNTGLSQAYLLSQASKCHYEELANTVIKKIWGRDIEINIFYQRAKTKTTIFFMLLMINMHSNHF